MVREREEMVVRKRFIQTKRFRDYLLLIDINILIKKCFYNVPENSRTVSE